MARHEHAPANEQTGPSQAARLAALDEIYVTVISTAGLPVPVRPPFSADYFSHATAEQIAHAIAVLNWAHRSGAEEALKDLFKNGKDVKDLSDDAKIAYAKAFMNSGGTVEGMRVKPYAFPESLNDMSLLEESIDRVRFDTVAAVAREGGTDIGEYDANKSAADIAKRATVRAALRAGFETGLVCNPKDLKTGEEQLPDGHPMKGRTYADLVEAKAAEVLAARYEPKTRNAKPKAEAVGY